MSVYPVVTYYARNLPIHVTVVNLSTPVPIQTPLYLSNTFASMLIPTNPPAATAPPVVTSEPEVTSQPDKVPPVILVKKNKFKVRTDSNIAKSIMKGISSSDNYDGDLTSTIYIPNIDAYLLNTYQKIKLISIDSSGNKTTKKAKLYIQSNVKKMNKTIYSDFGLWVYKSIDCNGGHKKFGTLKPGKIKVTGYDENLAFYRIKYKGKYGWIDSNYYYTDKNKKDIDSPKVNYSYVKSSCFPESDKKKELEFTTNKIIPEVYNKYWDYLSREIDMNPSAYERRSRYRKISLSKYPVLERCVKNNVRPEFDKLSEVSKLYILTFFLQFDDYDNWGKHNDFWDRYKTNLQRLNCYLNTVHYDRLFTVRCQTVYAFNELLAKQIGIKAKGIGSSNHAWGTAVCKDYTGKKRKMECNDTGFYLQSNKVTGIEYWLGAIGQKGEQIHEILDTMAYLNSELEYLGY